MSKILLWGIVVIGLLLTMAITTRSVVYLATIDHCLTYLQDAEIAMKNRDKSFWVKDAEKNHGVATKAILRYLECKEMQ